VAINFPIVTTFDDKATKKADKAFSTLGRKFAAVFSVAAVVKFGKASVKAFNDSQREAALLATQLEAVNLGFASPLLNDFIDKLELTSGLAGKDLTNAFISLSQATGDATTAQNILTTALDVSLGTGKSLQTVSIALQRAYKGETTALARLRIGYTTAELKGKKFDDVLEDLQNKFTGASARAVDTFAGKMARLSASVEQAQEAFGEGLVSGIEKSDMSIEELQESIIGLGQALGDLTAGVITFSNTAIDKFEDIEKSSAVQGVLNIFEALVRGVGFVVTGELVPTMDQATARRAVEERRKNEEANRATLRNRNQLLKSEQKITKSKKEQEKLTDKEKKNALALAKAKAVFDLDKIQIEAALMGKITEEERTRLLLMRAILEEDAATATKLADRLEKIQQQTVKLAESLTNLKAGDPFSEWDGYFANAKKNLQDLFKTLADQQIVLNNLMSSIATGRATANANVLAAKTDKASTFKEAAEASAIFAALSSADAVAAVAQAAAAVASAVTPEEKAAAQEAVEAANAYVDATSLLTESLAAADLAAALAELELANEYLNQSIEAATSQGLVPEVNVTVNVEGSVIAAEDLAETITDIQYEYQRTGKGLLFSSIAI
jgi:hypothetical protein